MENLNYLPDEYLNNGRKILEISDGEMLAGSEFSHFMLKPEALSVLDNNPEIRDELFLRLFQAISALGLEVVWTGRDQTPHSVFEQIYQKEITAGIIPDWEVSRFSENDTFHIVVKGINAISKTYRIKGRFCSDEISKALCLPQDDGVDLEQIFGGTYQCSGWGSGCGVRGFLARTGIVQPDEGIDNYTVYNWIHTPDPGQGYAVGAIIDAINNKLIK